MADTGNKQSRTEQSPRPAQSANPAEEARRELVQWCEEHQLPVPVDRRPGQSNGR